MNPDQPTLATAVATLAAEVDVLRATAECGIDLATRLDTLEHDLAELQVRLGTLSTLGPLPQPGAAGPPPAAGYQFPVLAEWVDAVFTRLAARHQARWCPRWTDHLEAVARLQLLWHTWEPAHAEPANHQSRDEWMRLVFDHHTTWLLDREGPFAGCSTDRCALAPRLPQRALSTPGLRLVAPPDAPRRPSSATRAGAR